MARPRFPALRELVTRALAGQVVRGARVCVGLSGGLDSMTLLDILWRLAPVKGWQLSALHVNHQLSAHADAWAAFCRRECRARGVPLVVRTVAVARGNSTEAAAREARHAVYRACGADHVLLAHHLDDQAETVLLRLARGAGVRGLAGMARARRAGAVNLVRPLLDVPRSRIEAYARRRRLNWITDDSNADTRYSRNHLRVEVLPRLARVAPAYRETLARAAANCAEGAQLLDELACLDAGDALAGDALALRTFAPLTPARRANLLRYFLRTQGARAPDRRALEEMLRQACATRTGARVAIPFGAHVLHVHAGGLHVAPRVAPPPAGFARAWRGERELAVDELHGVLTMVRARGDGIARERLRDARVEVRARAGGERLQLDPRRPRRPVKDLLRESGIAPWRRERLPFVWCDGKLAWVAELGVDHAFRATPGRAGMVPGWREVRDDAAD
jgi:tRNA(Ile)-lysidine synthase